MSEERVNFLDKETGGIKNKYWGAVLVVPVVVNILAWIPNPTARGSYETWIGFFGNYSGAIVGAFVALLIVKEQIKADEEKASNEAQTFAKVIAEFLFDEMRDNLGALEPIKNALQKQGQNEILDTTYILEGTKSKISTKIYDDLKYDIPKYNNKFIYDSINFYKALSIIQSFKTVNEIPTEKAKYASDIIESWSIKLSG